MNLLLNKYEYEITFVIILISSLYCVAKTLKEKERNFHFFSFKSNAIYYYLVCFIKKEQVIGIINK
jgi:hypothetical protein